MRYDTDDGWGIVSSALLQFQSLRHVVGSGGTTGVAYGTQPRQSVLLAEN